MKNSFMFASNKKCFHSEGAFIISAVSGLQFLLNSSQVLSHLSLSPHLANSTWLIEAKTEKDKKEIDLLVIRDDKIYPLEFKRTSSPNRMMVSSFQLLEKLNLSVQKGGIICLADTLLPITTFCDAIPVWLL